MDSVITNPEAWMPSTHLLIPIMVVLGGVIGGVVSAYATYVFTRKRQLEAEWRKDKLKYYSQFLESITELMSMPKEFNEVQKQFTRSYNLLCLFAPQSVANIADEWENARQASWDNHLTGTEEDQVISDQRERLRQLVLAMRKDLRIKPRDKSKTFKYMIRSPMLDMESEP